MIYLASDHGGHKLKSKIKDQISKVGYKVDDCGNDRLDSEDDFVDFAAKAAGKIEAAYAMGFDEPRGIFLCRNGVGVDIVANRYPQIRSVLGFDEGQVEKARTDDDVNVLCLPADYINEEKAHRLVEVFLNTKFSGEERFKRRLGKINKLVIQ